LPIPTQHNDRTVASGDTVSVTVFIDMERNLRRQGFSLK